MLEEVPPAGESSDVRLRRMRMQSWRRGTREMDLVLGRFADAELAALVPAELDAFETLLSENDHDIYQWIAGRVELPAGHLEIVRRIRAFHRVD
jgi:antitoxin CptB